MKLEKVNQVLANIQEAEEEKNSRHHRNISPQKYNQNLGSRSHIPKWTVEKYNPTNTEIAFLEKIHFKNLNEGQLKHIAQKDFGINEAEYSRLKEVGLLKFIKDNRVVSLYKESDEMLMSRAWVALAAKFAQNGQNAKENIPGHIQEPSKEVISQLQLHDKAQPRPLVITSADYKIFFKRLQGVPLSTTEMNRVRSLVRDGILPDGNELKEAIKKIPRGWRLKNARNKHISEHLLGENNINIEALKFVNTFKQVTPEQFLKFLGDDHNPSKIDRYLKNLDVNNEFTSSSRLLNLTHLPGPSGRISFLTINHVGDINGRKILQQHIDKQKINSRPQLRPDLLYHDLKAVDAVLVIKKELEQEGAVIKQILNESAQYSVNKIGVQNDRRSNTPSYMDAIIEIEKIDPLTGEKSLERIAVEYGNYSLERMSSKINSAVFDKAYVFADANYTKRYAEKINTNKNVTFRSI
ncbi:MAG: hypothetical protein HQK53_05665 [Oligoflexia bacterium]|nr:hypothetical protein [Oligoflexia bacterium]